MQGGAATLSQTNNFTGGTSLTGGTAGPQCGGSGGAGNITQSGGTLTESTANAFTGLQNYFDQRWYGHAERRK